MPARAHGLWRALALCSCSFRLKDILPPGAWTGPGGVRPNRRLIVVTATYRKGTSSSSEARGATKMTGSTVTLNYGDRESFVRGLADLLTRPTLTMELEFLRDITWTDWKNVQCTPPRLANQREAACLVARGDDACLPTHS